MKLSAVKVKSFIINKMEEIKAKVKGGGYTWVKKNSTNENK